MNIILYYYFVFQVVLAFGIIIKGVEKNMYITAKKK